MKNLHGVRVGDELFVVRQHHGQVHPTTEAVEGVGRRWVTVGKGHSATRFDLDTGEGEYSQYSFAVRAYRSEAHYLAEQKLADGWAEIRHRVDRQSGVPKSLSQMAVDTILKLLDEAEVPAGR